MSLVLSNYRRRTPRLDVLKPFNFSLSNAARSMGFLGGTLADTCFRDAYFSRHLNASAFIRLIGGPALSVFGGTTPTHFGFAAGNKLSATLITMTISPSSSRPLVLLQ